MAEIGITLAATVTGQSQIVMFRKELQGIKDEETLRNRESILASAKNRAADKLDAKLKRDMQNSLNKIFIRRQHQIKQLREKEKKASIEADIEFKKKFDRSIELLREEKAAQDALNESKARGRRFLGEAVSADIDKEYTKRLNEKIRLEKEMVAVKKEQTMAENTYRQELMQASIGMFVMGITMTQTLGVMEQMVGKGTELGNVFKDMGMGARFMLGPIQVATAAMQFFNQKNKELMLTMTKTMFIFAGAFLIYKAFTSESKSMRFALGALGGALIALNAILLVSTARTWANTYADIINKMVKTAGGAAPILAAAIGAGALMGFAAMATAPKGQTIPGYSREVPETGLIYAHKGESLGRGFAMSPEHSGGMVVNIYVPENSIVDTGMVDYLTGQLEVINASGRGA